MIKDVIEWFAVYEVAKKKTGETLFRTLLLAYLSGWWSAAQPHYGLGGVKTILSLAGTKVKKKKIKN